MNTRKQEAERGLVSAVTGNKCPHCRQGNIFLHTNPYNLKTTMQMPEACPVCGQKLELQTGFYFGTGFVSYGLTVLFMGLNFVIWWFTLGMSVHDDRVWWWLGSNAVLLLVLQPLIQRLSRTIWLALFVSYNPHWQEDMPVVS